MQRNSNTTSLHVLATVATINVVPHDVIQSLPSSNLVYLVLSAKSVGSLQTLTLLVIQREIQLDTSMSSNVNKSLTLESNNIS